MTAADYCYDAALETGIVGIENSLPPAVLTWMMRKFNRLADAWNANRDCVVATEFASYALTPNLQPHTIGPAGTFNITQRPVEIEFANIVITGVTPTVTTPIAIHKSYAAWWAAQSVQGLTSQYPSDLYYQAAWPLGKLWLWPVPTTAYQIQLFTRAVFSRAMIPTTVMSFAPGYENAFILTLAEECGGSPFEQMTPPDLAARAATARRTAFANNLETPLLDTQDSGMPNGDAGGYLNWRTGQMAK